MDNICSKAKIKTDTFFEDDLYRMILKQTLLTTLSKFIILKRELGSKGDVGTLYNYFTLVIMSSKFTLIHTYE